MTVNHHPKKDWTNQDNAILCYIMETLRPFNVSIYRQEHYSTHHCPESCVLGLKSEFLDTSYTANMKL